MQRIVPSSLQRAAGRHDQAWAVVGATQLGGHQENLVAQRLQGDILEVRGQTEPLEPVDQVVGQKQQMEIGLIGEKVPCGDAAQRIVALELLDHQFDAGAVVVQAPEIERLQRLSAPML